MKIDLDEVRISARLLDQARDELHFAEIALEKAKAKVERLKQRHQGALSLVS